MEKVRIGVIGLGGMGGFYARQMKNVARVELGGVCDINAAAAKKAAEDTGSRAFTSASEMIKSGSVDAVIVATPHFSHGPLAIEAMQAGLHVLVEKPIGSTKRDAELMIAAHTNKSLKFAVMFQNRSLPLWKKVRDLVKSGEIGEIRRTCWTITNWFRTQCYYGSSNWRGTWNGEGGGVLLNQCPHQLDLFQWITGMPTKIRAFCHLGKHHQIEVEDEVTAYMEYANKATGLFITSTGEAPGVDRFEIVGDRGTLLIQKNEILFLRNEIGASEFIRTSDNGFAAPPIWEIKIPVAPAPALPHLELIKNFADAILDNKPMLAEAHEGINSVELANAMLLSSVTEKTVQLPIDSAQYEKELKTLQANSKIGKKS